jgi:toxin ParE1/3/4
MPGEILRLSQARLDLIDIWNYIADDNEAAANWMFDRIEGVLRMLSEQPKAGREGPELAPELRSLPVGNYLLFYLPLPGGIDLVGQYRKPKAYGGMGPSMAFDSADAALPAP